MNVEADRKRKRKYDEDEASVDVMYYCIVSTWDWDVNKA